MQSPSQQSEVQNAKRAPTADSQSHCVDVAIVPTMSRNDQDSIATAKILRQLRGMTCRNPAKRLLTSHRAVALGWWSLDVELLVP